MFESLASCFAFLQPIAQHDSPKSGPSQLPANGNHFAIRLVVISEIMFPRLSLDHIEKELFQLFITRTRPQRLYDIELQIAAEARA